MCVCSVHVIPANNLNGTPHNIQHDILYDEQRRRVCQTYPFDWPRSSTCMFNNGDHWSMHCAVPGKMSSCTMCWNWIYILCYKHLVALAHTPQSYTTEIKWLYSLIIYAPHTYTNRKFLKLLSPAIYNKILHNIYAYYLYLLIYCYIKIVCTTHQGPTFS